MKYVYPAIFKEGNNQILVSVPDLNGCHTFGDNLSEAIEMTRDAISLWLCIAEDKKENIPEPSKIIYVKEGFISYIDTDTIEYRRLTDNRAVKKTLSIPSWLNAKAEAAGVNFSSLLQEALKEKLNVN